MKTAYSYTRFSTPEQKKGASGGRQIDAAIDWCKRNGYALSEERFRDEGKSAFKGKNIQGEGDLKRFVSLVESGKIRPGSVLVLESFDRLSRLPPLKAFSLFVDIINAGIGVVFTMTGDQKLITEDVISREHHLLYVIIGEAQRAHSESKIKSERVKQAYDKRKERAKQTGYKSLAWCPPWCDFDKDKGYVVNEGRAAIVRRIYDEYLKGNGAFRICRILNLEKVPVLGHRSVKTYRNTQREWYKKALRDFLFDKRVYGYCEFLDKEGFYPPIISRQKFNMVQNRLALRSAEKPSGGPVESVGNLFTGICRCAQCGCVMRKTSTRKKYKKKVTLYEYLVCDGAAMGMGCGYESIPYCFVEDTFLSVLHLGSSFHAAMLKTDDKAENRLAALQGEHAMNEKQIVKLTKLVLDDEAPSVTLVAKLKELEAKRIDLKKAIRLAEAQRVPAAVDGEALAQLINGMNTKMRDTGFRLQVREYIRSSVKSISLDTKSDFKNYQVTFKNGAVCSVVMWRNGKEESKGVSFQVVEGVRKAYDPKDMVFSS